MVGRPRLPRGAPRPCQGQQQRGLSPPGVGVAAGDRGNRPAPGRPRGPAGHGPLDRLGVAAVPRHRTSPAPTCRPIAPARPPPPPVLAARSRGAGEPLVLGRPGWPPSARRPSARPSASASASDGWGVGVERQVGPSCSELTGITGRACGWRQLGQVLRQPGQVSTRSTPRASRGGPPAAGRGSPSTELLTMAAGRSSRIQARPAGAGCWTSAPVTRTRSRVSPDGGSTRAADGTDAAHLGLPLGLGRHQRAASITAVRAASTGAGARRSSTTLERQHRRRGHREPPSRSPPGPGRSLSGHPEPGQPSRRPVAGTSSTTGRGPGPPSAGGQEGRPSRCRGRATSPRSTPARASARPGRGPPGWARPAAVDPHGPVGAGGRRGAEHRLGARREGSHAPRGLTLRLGAGLPLEGGLVGGEGAGGGASSCTSPVSGSTSAAARPTSGTRGDDHAQPPWNTTPWPPSGRSR